MLAMFTCDVARTFLQYLAIHSEHAFFSDSSRNLCFYASPFSRLTSPCCPSPISCLPPPPVSVWGVSHHDVPALLSLYFYIIHVSKNQTLQDTFVYAHHLVNTSMSMLSCASRRIGGLRQGDDRESATKPSTCPLFNLKTITSTTQHG